MTIALWAVILAAALAVLIKGADIFVDRASRAAGSLGISQAVIGVTLVALGTSLPELAASMASVLHGSGEFVAGTVVGSNIANIGLILGLAALVFKGARIGPQIKHLDLPVMLAAALMLTYMGWDGTITRGEAFFLLAMYGVYLMQVMDSHHENREERDGQRFGLKEVLWLAVSGVAIYFGAEWTVKAADRLTTLLGLADTSVLALSVVAVGSSLPELVVTLTAAGKGYHDLSVGNVVGSNICNTLVVTGIPAMVAPLPFSPTVTNAGLPIMVLVSLMLVVFAGRDILGRSTGMLLLIFFVFFLCRLGGLV